MSGVLPIGLGDARKLTKIFTEDHKEYVCVMQLHGEVDEGSLRQIVKEFEGEIYQKPPVRSSVKRRLRKRKIYSIELKELRGKYALLYIASEAGTYMRKLCHDIGQVTGTGAHMRELRRTKSGPFRENVAVSLHELSEAVYLMKNCSDDSLLSKMLIPMEYGVCGIPKVVISDYAVDPLAHGSPLMIPGILAYQEFEKGSLVATITQKGELVSIGEARISSRDLNALKKGEAITTDRVFMDTGVYPKRKKE